MVQLRGVEVNRDGGDIIVTAIVKTDDKVEYQRHELYRNQPVNRGRIITEIGSVYGIPPGSVVWPKHISVHDI